MKEFREVISYFVKVIWQASKLLTIILFLLSLGGGLTLIVELWAMMSLINQLVELDFSQSTFWRTTKTLLPWVLLFIGAMLLKHSIESFRPYNSKLLIFLSISFKSFKYSNQSSSLFNANIIVVKTFTILIVYIIKRILNVDVNN